MTDAFDLSQLAQVFKTSQPAPPPLVPSVDEMSRLLAAVGEEQRREHRTLFCRPDCADRLRAAVQAEGLAPWVTVVASELAPEGQVLVAHTPLDENGELRVVGPGELR